MRFNIHIYDHSEDEVLEAIKELKEILIMTQKDFDDELAVVNEKLDAIGVDVAAEADEIKAFIDAQPPEVDTSALQGVADRLSTLDDGIKGIFTPPAAPAPVEEPVA